MYFGVLRHVVVHAAVAVLAFVVVVRRSPIVAPIEQILVVVVVPHWAVRVKPSRWRGWSVCKPSQWRGRSFTIVSTPWQACAGHSWKEERGASDRERSCRAGVALN